MVKVSIIVPVYNVEKYLKKCLESIINQTLKEIEIICINDGSRDKSLEILKKYANKDSRIKIINKDNEGQSVARNIGIKEAKGEFLGFVDSDDWIDLDYFEKLYNTAKKYQADIACAGFKRCNFFNKSIRKSYKSENVLTEINQKVKADNLPEHNYIWNKIYKTDVWKNFNFTFEKGRYYEDVALVIKFLYFFEKLVTVPNTYYYYRRNNSSTVAKKNKKFKNDAAWANSESRNFAKEHGIYLGRVNKRVYIKLFNLFPIMKIYYINNSVRYLLFGFIPFITKTSY